MKQPTPLFAPRAQSGRPVGPILGHSSISAATTLTPSNQPPARRDCRLTFCRAAPRRDSSRRCSDTCSGWLPAHRSGSKDSRPVSPVLNRSTSRC